MLGGMTVIHRGCLPNPKVEMINESWLMAPNYRGLDGLKAEIQVRTVLMHAWAEIEHKLAYKSADQVPDKFRRKLYRLSAKFEEADEQFEDLRVGLSEYRAQVRSATEKAGESNKSLELNLDTLQAFVNHYYPGRLKSIKATGELLTELTAAGVSMENIVAAHQKVGEHIPAIEAAVASRKNTWSQSGVLRMMLDIADDKYRATRKRVMASNPKWADEVQKWRKRLYGIEKE